MSVLTTVEAVPNRLRLIFHYFCGKTQPESLERIENLMSPLALRHGSDAGDGDSPAAMFRNTLREAYALKMVEESEGKLRFVGKLLDKRRQNIDTLFIDWVEPRLLAPGVSTDYQQENVADAFAWLLMQSPMRPLAFGENYAGLIRRQFGDIPDVFDLTNKERFQNLAYWARYLGYCTLIGDRAVVADPTGALARWLPVIFAKENQMTIDNFMRELALKIPVLEEGSVRRRLEDLAADSLRSDPRRLSQSTSLALKRLAERGRIGLKDLSDAQNRILDLGDQTQRVSHVVLPGGKA
jgi:hypothetical protein